MRIVQIQVVNELFASESFYCYVLDNLTILLVYIIEVETIAELILDALEIGKRTL